MMLISIYQITPLDVATVQVLKCLRGIRSIRGYIRSTREYKLIHKIIKFIYCNVYYIAYIINFDLVVCDRCDCDCQADQMDLRI